MKTLIFHSLETSSAKKLALDLGGEVELRKNHYRIHTKKDLIKSIEDFNGLKLRGPTRAITKLLAGLGATPVGMPVPQVAPSLSKGVIDGMVVPWEVMPSFKLHELTKAHTEVSGDRGLYTTPFLFLMNKYLWVD